MPSHDTTASCSCSSTPADEVPTITRPWADAKPIVAAIPADLTNLDAAAREVAAVQVALEDPTVADDWVARRELGERMAQTRAALDRASHRHLQLQLLPMGASWTEGRELQGGRGSAALSEAADIAYSLTPRVRNEMLNRTELTSQGAKARGLLLAAMIEHGADAGPRNGGIRPRGRHVPGLPEAHRAPRPGQAQ